jgi:O-acetylhomoserine/O-acetylserine sulfhydrylase-like pyridoxal-dependent enzyme
MGIETSFVDCTDAEKVKKSIKPNTKVCVTLSVLSSVNVKKKMSARATCNRKTC